MTEHRARILFFGTPHFAAVGLKALLDRNLVTVGCVVTQPDKPAGRGNESRPSPVKELALAAGIPVYQPRSLRKALPDFFGAIAPHGPFDLGVVIAFGQILPTEVLSTPLLGCLNVHASLLPRWRGAAPIQRALMAGDERTGVCLMKMDAGLDTGAVYSRAECAIPPGTTCGELHDKLASLGAELLIRDIPAILQGSLPAEPQPSEGVTYAHKITNDEALLDWRETAEQLERKIRALSPVPGAYTTLHGKRFKIFRAALAELPTPLPPGSVLPSVAGVAPELRIACGRGALVVLEAQMEGKRRLSAEELLRGLAVSPGEIVGHNQGS